jgi:hypothetical protein
LGSFPKEGEEIGGLSIDFNNKERSFELGRKMIFSGFVNISKPIKCHM